MTDATGQNKMAIWKTPNDAVIHRSTMDIHMQNAVTKLVDACTEFNYTRQETAEFVLKMMENKFGKPWFFFAGEGYGVSQSAAPMQFVDFSFTTLDGREERYKIWKYLPRNLNGGAQVVRTNMPIDMVKACLRVAEEATRGRAVTDRDVMADYIVERMNQAYTPAWHAVIGDFSGAMGNKLFIEFTFEGRNYLVWRTPTAPNIITQN